MKLSELNVVLEVVETELTNLHFNSRQKGEPISTSELEKVARLHLSKIAKKVNPLDVSMLVQKGVTNSQKFYDFLFSI